MRLSDSISSPPLSSVILDGVMRRATGIGSETLGTRGFFDAYDAYSKLSRTVRIDSVIIVCRAGFFFGKTMGSMLLNVGLRVMPDEEIIAV